jgi:hypothetical protein
MLNIGDYTQSLAVQEIIGKDVYYVDREHLDKEKEEVKILLNG